MLNQTAELLRLRDAAAAGKQAEDELIAALSSLASANAPDSPEAMEAESELTILYLSRIQRGGNAARGALFNRVKASMRDKAGQLVAQNRADVQPTMLVNDAFLDLLKSDTVAWSDRTHFLSFAARRMHQIFTDYDRRRRAAKSDGGRSQADIDEVDPPIFQSDADYETRLRVLKMLRKHDRECYEVILLRYYADLSVDEAAELLAVHPNTVKNKTRTALRILKAELENARED
jgi:RNA polymerase sigma factor (TIGR02999 family)